MSLDKINFKHLLLTRFNLDYSANGTPYICDEKWHKDRFELFQRFCLPAVAHQTCRDFEWIIQFNENERERYGAFISKTQKSLDTISFLFVKPKENPRKKLIEFIRDHYSFEYLITTRMDNDDVIASHFIESIQNDFKKWYRREKNDAFIINAGTGYQFETKFPYRKTLIQDYSYSPFISLVSRADNQGSFRIVFEHTHPKWEKVLESDELKNGPCWIQIIHNRNRANQVLSLNLLLNIRDEKFAFMNDVERNGYWFGVFMLPLQYLMTLAKRLTKKVRKTLIQT